MYSEEFVKYLLKYQNSGFKTAEKKETEKSFSLNEIKRKYVSIPLVTK